MINIPTRCEGAFLGHAIASNYDPSISMAMDISESLLTCRKFNGPDILSRFLYLYHTQRCEVGETTKFLYTIALNKRQSESSRSITSHDDFLFDQSMIHESVKTTHDKLNGYTAGCGPAQRSFPLAFYPLISDDDLFDVSKEEAALTHHHPLAGQVAGIINHICRSLSRNKSWHDAVQSAFYLPRLEPDISKIQTRYSRSPQPFEKTHPAYAPTVLNAALYYVTNATNPMNAIESVQTKENYYCAPIVGILAGARWGIPAESCKHKCKNEHSQKIHDTASKLSNQWTSQQDHIFA
ncbi:hypothetical protein I4U23_030654 [Adineta vaga]|nr:hypothetical protein I4U23_030654 [Adineta vaga]